MISLLTDPHFYLVGIPAVILVGLSKGGFGGAMALLGVPLLALVVSPVQAAAILLPVLIVMDIVSLWTWRGFIDKRLIAIMLPGQDGPQLGHLGRLAAAQGNEAFAPHGGLEKSSFAA